MGGDRSALIRCLGNQAAILYDQNHTSAALEGLMEQARLCRESKAPDELMISLGNQVIVVRKLIAQEAEGGRDQASQQNILAWLQTLEQLYRELVDTTNVILVLHEQALIHKSLGQTEEVMRLCKEEERLCREVQGATNLANCLCEQAVALYGWRCYHMAYKLTQEQLQICRDIGDIGGLVTTLGNAAELQHRLNNLREALAHAEEAQRLCKEHGMAEAAVRIRPVVDALRSMVHGK